MKRLLVAAALSVLSAPAIAYQSFEQSTALPPPPPCEDTVEKSAIDNAPPPPIPAPCPQPPR